MKKIIFILSLAIISSGITYAQNTFPSTGNVGIGTNNPTYKFEVHGNDGGQVAVFGNNGSTNFGLQGSLFIKSNSSTSTASLSSGGANSGLTFLTNNSGTDYVRMQITSTGNVGIGTTTPGSDLTITRNGTGMSVNAGSSGYFGTLAFNRESATGAIFNPTGNAFQINNGNGTDKNLHIQVYSGSGAGVNPDALTINGTTSGVGINTASVPAGYQFAVNGGVIATSVTVKLYTAWPDYVFKPTYQLPSLTDVKTYIDQNQHLPEIPSEQEVAKDGLNLGEMNRLLLKKVEELTLYAIENERKDKEKDKLLASLQQQINRLNEKQNHRSRKITKP
ncbi:hypothetical protein [Mucilaginibacter sp. SJ]|uniref:hypothetical protein n=1 Tax=Mucilaginibacter sp. SJ TaxID=3029053 RepID=UPI0023A93F50|nr:hypothetical protein [Mucilaginibacter sp. SJ]WEA00682.1 hypothetical protein MusilaSJ_24820 [Mucilaginibacter sp. SJ]